MNMNLSMRESPLANINVFTFLYLLHTCYSTLQKDPFFKQEMMLLLKKIMAKTLSSVKKRKEEITSFPTVKKGVEPYCNDSEKSRHFFSVLIRILNKISSFLILKQSFLIGHRLLVSTRHRHSKRAQIFPEFVLRIIEEHCPCIHQSFRAAFLAE